MTLPKINFFGFSRSFDFTGKMNGDAAVNGIEIKASDDEVVLAFKTFPDHKVAEVGIHMDAWRLIEEAIKKSLEPKKEIAVSKYDPDRWNKYPDVTPPSDGSYLVTIYNKVCGTFVTTSFYSKYLGWDDVLDEDVKAFRGYPQAYYGEEE
nr:MAG TPA: hypothetical protein [Caudoviricetes sp.]